MNRQALNIHTIFLLLSICMFQSCMEDSNGAFELHTGDKRGISFENTLSPNLGLNIFNYMYFYNGGGIASGDFNNDGLIDLFFTGNRIANELYVNKGNLQFEQAIVFDHDTLSWSTGASVVDINQDGLLDIYVSQVGEYENIKGTNLLYINQGNNDNGIPSFKEESAQYGLDLVGFSTQAVFFDYDLDNDLDLFQLNHSVHRNGTFGKRTSFDKTYHPLAGDKFFVNESGRFIDKTKEVGINSSVIGYGLGVSVGDLNMDGYPDLYVGNDFHENDYLYINNKNGTFSEQLTEQLMHTSRFSMGVDIADINNDAQPDIMTLDMLPYDPYILKKSEGEDALSAFRFKLGYGYNHQYAKNTLQLNNGNNTFSDVAQSANVHATDWSWAPLIEDFDNDGIKDIFISNGIPKRMNDMDYIDFISNDDIQYRVSTSNANERDLSYLDQLPEIKLENKLFKGNKDLAFTEFDIQSDKESYSNGAIVADLDNDGDIDIVTNNINGPIYIYENKIDNDNRIIINTNGVNGNKQAIGSKLIIRKKDGPTLFDEKYPVTGFQSSMESSFSFGIGDVSEIEEAIFVWPDLRYQRIDISSLNHQLSYDANLPKIEDLSTLIHKNKEKENIQFIDITEKSNLDFTHKENPFSEFDREILIPHSTSTEGPALAVGDVNGDGRDDFFIGGSKRNKAELFFQTSANDFIKKPIPAIYADSIYEDVDASFIDIDNDEDLDLIVASGGNEYYNKSKYLNSRIYTNDGTGNFTRTNSLLDSIYQTSANLLAGDYNNDGHLDLLMAARAQPWRYGHKPQSYLLKNNGSLDFEHVTESIATDLSNIGMITYSEWFDIDQDNDLDMLVCVEWDHIYVFENQQDRFVKRTLTDKTGLWTFCLPFDVDQDGDMDLIAGNLGLNSRLKASTKEPLRFYHADFDDNGTPEQFLTHYVEGREIPFSNKRELEKQVPSIKRSFLKAEEFAKANVNDLFKDVDLQEHKLYETQFLENAILLNKGDLTFETIAMPRELQLTTYKTAITIPEFKAVLLGGNYYDCNVQMGRYDADYGTLIQFDSIGVPKVVPAQGLSIKGQIRKIKEIKLGEKPSILIARNNDSLKLLSYSVENEPNIQ